MSIHGFNLRLLLAAMVAAQFLIVLYAIFSADERIEQLQIATRFSGRLSLLIFSFIFLRYLPGRRHQLFDIFLVFALAHGIHLLELLSYQFMSGSLENLLGFRTAGGFVAYLIIFSVPILHRFEQNDRINYKVLVRIEYIYIFFIWTVFLMTYLPRVMKTMTNVGGYWYEFLIAFLLIAAMMLFKIIQLLRYYRVQVR